jgi:hypothetical protein
MRYKIFSFLLFFLCFSNGIINIAISLSIDDDYLIKVYGLCSGATLIFSSGFIMVTASALSSQSNNNDQQQYDPNDESPENIARLINNKKKWYIISIIILYHVLMKIRILILLNIILYIYGLSSIMLRAYKFRDIILVADVMFWNVYVFLCLLSISVKNNIKMEPNRCVEINQPPEYNNIFKSETTEEKPPEYIP